MTSVITTLVEYLTIVGINTTILKIFSKLDIVDDKKITN